MSLIKGTLGAFRGRQFLKNGLETAIANVDLQQSFHKNEEFNDLMNFEQKFVGKIQKKLGNPEDAKISEATEKDAFEYMMSGDSSRYRPMLVFLGSLQNPREQKVNSDRLAQIALAIEIIHKMSLILDDYFDGDDTRKGRPTFHTQYGKSTMLRMADFSMKLSNNIFLRAVDGLDENKVTLLQELYANIITDMGNGFLEDIDRDSGGVFIRRRCAKN